ncbi:MAG: nucleotidyl transferase AbiEii/AbiGii toxin family protein [bacterium]
MIKPKENKKCYASVLQRKILKELAALSYLESKFFLTGGTALSVFYIYHRKSAGLDFFTVDKTDLGKIDFALKRIWSREVVTVTGSEKFLSLLIKGIKVEFVIDHLSNRESRPVFGFENGRPLSVDTVRNIASNKLCAIVSRTEAKDLVDFYFIRKEFSSLSLSVIFKEARKKDAIFDDFPSAAFRIEENVSFFRNKPELFPKMIKKFDMRDFLKFYSDIEEKIYKKLKI